VLRQQAAAEVAARREAGGLSDSGRSPYATSYTDTFKQPQGSPRAGQTCVGGCALIFQRRGWLLETRASTAHSHDSPQRSNPSPSFPQLPPTARLGARVMKTRDGGPVRRDLQFLTEANLIDRAAADRIYRRQQAIHRGSAAATAAEAAAAAAVAEFDAAAGGDRQQQGDGEQQAIMGGSGAHPKPPPLDAGDEPITIYSFDPAAATGAGAGAPLSAGAATTGTVASALFYRTGGLKSRPMDRNDQFTKLMGDVNKLGDD